jgi:ribosomal protein RSM22 (predicted rRNA methylase)
VPLSLTRALEAVLAGEDLTALRRATARLIEVYRSGAPPAEPVLGDPVSAAAYAAYRMPATYAAVSLALRLGLQADPGSLTGVRSMVDLGGGTGAAAWAVADELDDLESVTVLDRSEAALATGRRVAAHGRTALASARWTRTLVRPGMDVPRADLVTVSYLLGELDPALQGAAVQAAASASRSVLVVEPGTPRGFGAVLAARDHLVAAGWHVLAPCPQPGPCPVAARPDDWCHFATRLDRTALHRRLKGAERGHEDEKLSFVLAVRDPVTTPDGRVLRRPRLRKGMVQLEVCRTDGSVGTDTVTRRDGVAYRAARGAGWGSGVSSSGGAGS